MTRRRWSKFWWSAWQADPALRMCSLAARGLWMEMLCIMADADPFGHLLVNGKVPTPRQLGSVAGGTEKEVAGLLRELEENGVFSRQEDGTPFSRRMLRDQAASEEGAEHIKRRWGNKDRTPTPNSANGSEPITPPNRGPERVASSAPSSPPTTVPNRDPNTKEDRREKIEERKKERTFASLTALDAPDARTMLFRTGLANLRDLTGKPDSSARSLLGKWLKSLGDDASELNAILAEAANLRPVEPISWIVGAVRNRVQPRLNEVEQVRARYDLGTNASPEALAVVDEIFAEKARGAIH